MSKRTPFQGAIAIAIVVALASAACSAADPGVGVIVSRGSGTSGLPDASTPDSSAGMDSGFETLPDASAQADAPTEAAAEAAPPAGPIVSFTLIDTSVTGIVNGSPVAGYDPIPNNSTISLARVGTQLSIRANVNAPVGSILFAYDQTNHTENASPYMLCGDDGAGTIVNCNLVAGTHTLTTTPYSAASLGGTAGPPLTLAFTLAP